uniref:BTB domain-containing protein n=1 Tax=Glossina pallidipes TaxID=7398 RepID=A0A1A9ZJS0_GLOPL
MAGSDMPPADLSEVNTSAAHAIGGTKVEVIKKLFTWTVENYRTWQDKGSHEGEYLTSPTFSTGANDESKWFTRFSKEYDRFKQKVEMHALSDAELTILCEISEMEVVNSSGQPQIMQRNAIGGKLSKDLGNLLDNEKFSDVTLVVSGLELKAHKSILAARSDVFAAMFEHEMEESKLNRVVINDIDYNVLKDMLTFMYTGTAPNLDKMSSDLLAVANKYALENLKSMCEHALSTKHSVKTAAETLVLADLYGAGQLKAHTIAYIKNHIADVMQTQGWEAMTKTHSYLITDVLRAFGKQ